MGKIKKNLSDTDMFANWIEKPTFENSVLPEEVPVRPLVKPVGKEQPKEFNSSFFTPELQEQVGKALLEIKMKLYKQGIVDYKIKVTHNDNQVVLTAIPLPADTIKK
jgi:hypothetical protein